MSRPFSICRDLSSYRFQKGSDKIVITQFDTGVLLTFKLFDGGEPLDLSGYQALVVFQHQKTKKEWSEKVSIQQDLSLTPSFYLTCELNDTEEVGEYVGILDLINPEGHKTSTAPFTLSVLPHLTTKEKLQEYWGER